VVFPWLLTNKIPSFPDFKGLNFCATSSAKAWAFSQRAAFDAFDAFAEAEEAVEALLAVNSLETWRWEMCQSSLGMFNGDIKYICMYIIYIYTYMYVWIYIYRI
jgi:hypothetical protein